MTFFLSVDISSYIGRPGTIHERDYDCGFPSENEPDEHEQWRPIRVDGTEWHEEPKNPSNLPPPEVVEHLKSYPPTRAHTLSCFNAAGSLAVIVNRVRFPFPPFPRLSMLTTSPPTDHLEHLRHSDSSTRAELRDVAVAPRPELGVVVSRSAASSSVQPDVGEGSSASRASSLFSYSSSPPGRRLSSSQLPPFHLPSPSKCLCRVPYSSVLTSFFSCRSCRSTSSSTRP